MKIAPCRGEEPRQDTKKLLEAVAAMVAAATSAKRRPAAAEVRAVIPEDPTPTTSHSRRAAVTLARV